MTDVIIEKHNGSIVSVECKGHTGYGAHGEDIVCAALSSIVQTAALGLLGVAQINIKLMRNEQTGHLLMEIPKNMGNEEQVKANAILDTMCLGVNDLYESYSDFLNVSVKEI